VYIAARRDREHVDDVGAKRRGIGARAIDRDHEAGQAVGGEPEADELPVVIDAGGAADLVAVGAQRRGDGEVPAHVGAADRDRDHRGDRDDREAGRGRGRRQGHAVGGHQRDGDGDEPRPEPQRQERPPRRAAIEELAAGGQGQAEDHQGERHDPRDPQRDPGDHERREDLGDAVDQPEQQHADAPGRRQESATDRADRDRAEQGRGADQDPPGVEPQGRGQRRRHEPRRKERQEQRGGGQRHRQGAARRRRQAPEDSHERAG
jgi:hypothetical protein